LWKNTSRCYNKQEHLWAAISANPVTPYYQTWGHCGALTVCPPFGLYGTLLIHFLKKKKGRVAPFVRYRESVTRYLNLGFLFMSRILPRLWLPHFIKARSTFDLSPVSVTSATYCSTVFAGVNNTGEGSSPRFTLHYWCQGSPTSMTPAKNDTISCQCYCFCCCCCCNQCDIGDTDNAWNENLLLGRQGSWHRKFWELIRQVTPSDVTDISARLRAFSVKSLKWFTNCTVHPPIPEGGYKEMSSILADQ